MKRAKLVGDMARFLLKKYDGKILNLVKKAASKIGGKTGIYALLGETPAYGEDPLRKKASVFIDLADELGLIKFSDWKNYLPPIDYHLARVLLRCGVVEILDKQLLEKLKNISPLAKKRI